jgi:hypothetical protein
MICDPQIGHGAGVPARLEGKPVILPQEGQANLMNAGAGTFSDFSTLGAEPLFAAGVEETFAVSPLLAAVASLTDFSAPLLLAVPGTRIGALQEGQFPFRPALLSPTRIVTLQLGHLKSIAIRTPALQSPTSV